MSSVVCVQRTSQVLGTSDIQEPQRLSRPVFSSTVSWNPGAYGATETLRREEAPEAGSPTPSNRDAPLRSELCELGV